MKYVNNNDIVQKLVEKIGADLSSRLVDGFEYSYDIQTKSDVDLIGSQIARDNLVLSGTTVVAIEDSDEQMYFDGDGFDSIAAKSLGKVLDAILKAMHSSLDKKGLEIATVLDQNENTHGLRIRRQIFIELPRFNIVFVGATLEAEFSETGTSLRQSDVDKAQWSNAIPQIMKHIREKLSEKNIYMISDTPTLDLSYAGDDAILKPSIYMRVVLILDGSIESVQ